MQLVKKGQAPIEFLMNYGWAILAVLTIIMALAYFGVISPPRMVPTLCTASPGFICQGVPIFATDNITLSLKNARTFTLSNPVVADFSDLNCDAGASNICGYGLINCPANITSLESSDIATIILSCSLSHSQTVKGEARIMFVNPESSLYERIVLKIAGRVP